MPETGIEDLIRGGGSSSNGGCGTMFLIIFGVMLVIVIAMLLLDKYFPPLSGSPDNVNTVNTNAR